MDPLNLLWLAKKTAPRQMKNRKNRRKKKKKNKGLLTIVFNTIFFFFFFNFFFAFFHISIIFKDSPTQFSFTIKRTVTCYIFFIFLRQSNHFCLSNLNYIDVK